MGKAVLFVLTNVQYLDARETTLDDGFTDISTQRRTGFDVKEVALAYYSLQVTRGLEINLASPAGGACYIDPASLKTSEHEEEVQAFLADECMRNWLKCTDELGTFDLGRFQAVLFFGGAGALLDFVECPSVKKVINAIYDDGGGMVGAIGHGVAALLNMADSSEEEKGNVTKNWLKGRNVTANTMEEDADMMLEKLLPFSIERRLRGAGAKFSKGKKFGINVVEDRHLITAQNRNSTREWLQIINKHLQV